MSKTFTPDQLMEILKTAIEENGLHSVMDALTEAVDETIATKNNTPLRAFLSEALEVLERTAEKIQDLDD
jgi:ABC-type uncharacterized transport system YnjBCD substrate-binding protein